MVKPPQLLKNFGVTGVCLDYSFVGIFCLCMLYNKVGESKNKNGKGILTFFCCSKTCPIWNQMSA